MKLGVIARSEDRGLGLQTWEVARHLNPERVLLVEPKPAGWIQHPERYADHETTVAQWHWGKLREDVVRRWLDGLDVVYTAESDYDLRMSGWCSAAGVTLVRHANPEQLAAEEIKHAGDTVWWAATPWRLKHLPAGTRVVPMPVALDRFPPRNPRDLDQPVRFLHSVGHQAQDDRAGTRCVSRAIQRVRERCELVVRCQDHRLDCDFNIAPHVDVQLHPRGIGNYWDGYDGDVLLLPRRYGGLSLPSQEAMAAGMALAMTACSPNEVWPGLKVPTLRRSETHMRCGPVDVWHPDPKALADIMSDLVRNRDRLAELQVEARRWAEANSWEALTPLWMAELERAQRDDRGRFLDVVDQRGGDLIDHLP